MFANDIAAGTGNMKKHAHRAHFRQLRRQAVRGHRPSRRDEITRRADAVTPEQLAGFGVKVVFDG